MPGKVHGPVLEEREGARGGQCGEPVAGLARGIHGRVGDLYLGQTHKIIEPLEQAGLTAQAEYFRKHTRRRRYQEFHEQNYPLGSGTVESDIKRFKHRLCGPGMRWSRPAAEQMLVIRAAVMADNFDELWTAALN